MIQKNRGAALITVLIIVLIIMSIITDITIKNYRVIRRLTNQKAMEQCYGILFAAADFGRAGLATSAATSTIDSITDIWAQPIPRTKVIDDIYMSGYIIDEQGKFNINDLVSNGQVNQTVLTQFTALLTSLNLPTALAPAIAYYMAAPQYETDIMNQYTNADPRYRPAGKPLVDLAELKLIKGMQPEYEYKLANYITAIPVSITGQLMAESAAANAQESTTNSNKTLAPPTGPGVIQVNVNTASAEVIAAKSGIPLPVANRIVSVRENTPFKASTDIQSFLASNGIITSQSNSNMNLTTLTTSSTYFTIHAAVDKGDYEFKWVELVYRANRTGQWPLILWHHPE
jgi:type II secretory pathway component PulK